MTSQQESERRFAGISWLPALVFAFVVQTGAIGYFLGTLSSTTESNTKRIDRIEANGSPAVSTMEAQIKALKEELDRHVSQGR